jgi:hypothetical protein
LAAPAQTGDADRSTSRQPVEQVEAVDLRIVVTTRRGALVAASAGPGCALQRSLA